MGDTSNRAFDGAAEAGTEAKGETGGKASNKDAKEGKRTMIESTLSAQDIWYELDRHQPWIEPKEMRMLICESIAKLPEKVQEFALFNCTFITVGKDDFGTVYPASLFTHRTASGKRTARNHWAIVLNARILTRKDGVFTVAHEIAHAWLKHQMWPELSNEEEADDLVKSWGIEIPKYRLKVHARNRDAAKRNGERKVTTNAL